jgi:DNA-binding IclR family transcriptional regulator
MATTTRDAGVKSAERTLNLLERIARAPRPATFAELSDGLGIPKSSLFHLLETLSRRGYVEQAGVRGGYRLGPAAFDLAQHAFTPDGVVARLQPLMRELTAELDCTVGYYEMRGDFMELLSATSARYARQIDIPLARMAPLYAASWGKALLADQSDALVDAYIARTPFRAFSATTLRTGEALKAEITEVRRTGFATSRGEFSVGVVSLALLLRQRGQMVGALGIAIPAADVTPEFEAEARRLLTATGARFGRMSTDLAPPTAP